MSLTAIFSDMGDRDCQHLTHFWDNFPDANVIHITCNSRNISRTVMNAILDEEDTLVMCGHGTPRGLLNPSYFEGGFLINENNAPMIHARRVIALWCYAKRFGKAHGLPGLWSDMFISNCGEARMNGINTNDADMIAQCCVDYCSDVNRLMHGNTPMDQWRDILVSQVDMTNPVYKFNYDGVEYLGEPRYTPSVRPTPVVSADEIGEVRHSPFGFSQTKKASQKRHGNIIDVDWDRF